MKNKIIEILKKESVDYTNEITFLYATDFEKVADEIIRLIKSEIYTDVDYLTESMFNTELEEK